MMPLVKRLVYNKKALEELPASSFRKFVNWVVKEVLDENVLTVENWLEISFHLCKQRWDQSMDWLESQPMSKIKAMLDVLESYNEAQNDMMKKG
jgi:hypothetical protein